MTYTPQLTDLEIELLIIERDTCQYKKERLEELLNEIGKAQGIYIPIAPSSTATGSNAKEKETTFTLLKYEPQKSPQLGDFDIAYKANNIEHKWNYAFNILKNSQATIKDRYYNQDYQFSYWVYGEGKIYRQKLKPKT